MKKEILLALLARRTKTVIWNRSRAYRMKLKEKPTCINHSTRPAEGHHVDYNKPMEVMWLCGKCHAKWHRENVAVQPSWEFSLSILNEVGLGNIFIPLANLMGISTENYKKYSASLQNVTYGKESSRIINSLLREETKILSKLNSKLFLDIFG